MRKKNRYSASHLPEAQFEPGALGRVLRRPYEQATARAEQLPFLFSFLRSGNVAHLLNQFLGEFRDLDANAFNSSRRSDGPLDQRSTKLGVFEVRVRL